MRYQRLRYSQVRQVMLISWYISYTFFKTAYNYTIRILNYPIWLCSLPYIPRVLWLASGNEWSCSLAVRMRGPHGLWSPAAQLDSPSVAGRLTACTGVLQSLAHGNLLGRSECLIWITIDFCLFVWYYLIIFVCLFVCGFCHCLADLSEVKLSQVVWICKTI